MRSLPQKDVAIKTTLSGISSFGFVETGFFTFSLDLGITCSCRRALTKKPPRRLGQVFGGFSEEFHFNSLSPS